MTVKNGSLQRHHFTVLGILDRPCVSFRHMKTGQKASLNHQSHLQQIKQKALSKSEVDGPCSHARQRNPQDAPSHFAFDQGRRAGRAEIVGQEHIEKAEKW